MKRSLAILGVISIVGLAGCELPTFFSSRVSCEDVTSAEWKSEPDARTYEFAEAIDRCGVLEGKSRAEIEEWMGPSQYYNEKRYMGWDLDAEGTGGSMESDWPMINVTLDKTGKFQEISIQKA